MGCVRCSLYSQYHLWVVPQASLIYPMVRRDSIFSPVLLKLCLISYCRADWKCLDTVRRRHCSFRWFHLKAILFYARRQLSSDIHTVIYSVLCSVFLSSFQRSVKPASSFRIGDLFGYAMDQMYYTLWYLIFRLSPHPLILSRIIRWSEETLVSLMLTLYK